MSKLRNELASQSFHRILLLSLSASELKSAATEDVSVLLHVPALVLGGSRALAKLRLATRATVILSRAAVSEEYISNG